MDDVGADVPCYDDGFCGACIPARPGQRKLYCHAAETIAAVCGWRFVQCCDHRPGILYSKQSLSNDTLALYRGDGHGVDTGNRRRMLPDWMAACTQGRAKYMIDQNGEKNSA